VATPDDLRVVTYYCNNTKCLNSLVLFLPIGFHQGANPIELIKPCIVTKSLHYVMLLDLCLTPGSYAGPTPGSYIGLAPGSGLITCFTDERTVGALSRLLLERGRGFEGRPRPSPACWAWGRGRGWL
jgi:hypothetical protein